MLPSGDSPQITSNNTAAITSLRPSDAKRVIISTAPMKPRPIRKFVGSRMKPMVLDSTKNKGSLGQCLVQRHTTSLQQPKAFS